MMLGPTMLQAKDLLPSCILFVHTQALTSTFSSYLGVLLGFNESSLQVAEDSGIFEVCIEICKGVLKRDVVVEIEERSITATCELAIYSL